MTEQAPEGDGDDPLEGHDSLHGSMHVHVPCKECEGTGRNGTLGGYRLLCQKCGGEGMLPVDYAFRIGP